MVTVYVKVNLTKLALIALVLAPLYVNAQDVPWFDIHGGIGLSTDAVQRTGGPSLEYPGAVHRASVNATITLFGQVSLPFEAYITSFGSGYSQPFNQFGIHPRFGNWLQLHGGYFNQSMSELTFGDVRLLGAGAVFTPGHFRATAIYGVALQAREPKPDVNYTGEYFRRMMGVSIGYKDSTDGASINVLYGKDDKNSITPVTDTRPPSENLVVSLAFTSAPTEALTLSGELGASAFTSDVRASLLDSADANGLIASIVTYNLSTSLDYAGRLSALLAVSKDYSLRAQASWTGPGFVSLGYVQMLNDMLDLTVSPSLKFFEGDLYISGSIGQRTNNLRNTRLATTSQLIASANISARFTEQLSLDAAFANFGMKSSTTNDTMRVSNVSTYLSLSPRYTFEALGGNNTLSLSFSIQQSEDVSQFLPAPITNDNLSTGASYMIAFPTSLVLITSGNRYRGISNGVTTDVVTVSQSANMPMFDNTVQLGGSVGFNIIQSSANTTQAFARVNGSYSLNEYGTFSLVIATNTFSYSATGALSYSEYTGSLQYSVSI